MTSQYLQAYAEGHLSSNMDYASRTNAIHA